MTQQEITLTMPADMWAALERHAQAWHDGADDAGDDPTSEPWTFADNLVDYVDLITPVTGWTDATHRNGLLDEAICDRENCGHAGRHHSPGVGCLVEAGDGDYCRCGLRPVTLADGVSVGWSVATGQDPADACPNDDDEGCTHDPCITDL